MNFTHGGKYSGGFKLGLKHGNGTYTWPDGAYYQGEFQEDRENGQGLYHFSNGDRYRGAFLNGRLHGNGTYTWASGTVFVGEHVQVWVHGRNAYIIFLNFGIVHLFRMRGLGTAKLFMRTGQPSKDTGKVR